MGIPKSVVLVTVVVCEHSLEKQVLRAWLAREEVV